MTEDEAKTKWCPFARWKFSTKSDSPASNREGGSSDDGRSDNPWLVKGTRCLASACMAWRSTKDPSLSWHSEERERHEERHGKFVAGGYCGLAGAPS